MLPLVGPLFTLVRQLGQRLAVTEIAAPKWLVQRHGLASMAARAGFAGYRDDLARSAVAWVHIERDVPPIVAAFRRAGIPVAAIKGVAYAKALYDVPAERPMGDVDLLVPKAHVDEARRVLADAGYRPGTAAILHHAEPWARDDLAIDLHWNIIGSGRSHIDLDAVWSRSVPGWPEGALRLEPTDSLVFHLVHLVRNRLRLPLMNVVDAARLLERSSADAAIERARSWGLGFAAQLALDFCQAIIEDRPRRHAPTLQPSASAITEIADPSIVTKVLFDIATAGSPRQLLSRVAHAGANNLRRTLRK